MFNDQLVIIQASPFCNINCSYCYLPERSNKTRISRDVLEAIFTQVFASSKFSDPITFVWHAGEPLALPFEFYCDAFELAVMCNRPYQRSFVHAIQTNGIAISAEFAQLFRKHSVDVGVSIDGPAFIHDRQRVTRSGKGTHEQVMRGIKQLQESKIPFGVIAVLTRYSLDYADEIFDFFLDNGLHKIAFNIDEMEGTHVSTSFDISGAAEGYRKFMQRFFERTLASNGQLKVREFRQVLGQLLSADDVFQRSIVNSTNSAMRILNFDHRGNFWTFSPELNGAKSETYNNFVMGNVRINSIDMIEENFVFQRVNREVQAGVELCRRNCQYWGVCGGGSPAGKFFEHGRFDVSETKTCRIHTKALTDVMLDYLEGRFAPKMARTTGGVH